MLIRVAQTETDLRRCLPALLALRPHLTAEQILALVQEQQAHERFSVAFVDPGDETDAPAVITFRKMTLLVSGKTIYIDDLSTLPAARGNGYASALLDFVIDHARLASFQLVSLDSGHGENRADAHRLYLNKRFRISSHHFSLPIHS